MHFEVENSSTEANHHSPKWRENRKTDTYVSSIVQRYNFCNKIFLYWMWVLNIPHAGVYAAHLSSVCLLATTWRMERTASKTTSLDATMLVFRRHHHRHPRIDQFQSINQSAIIKVA